MRLLSVGGMGNVLGINFALLAAGSRMEIRGKSVNCMHTMKTTALMKKFRFLLMIPVLAMAVGCEGLEDGLTDEEIVAGLKEALQVGADKSVAAAHLTDGFFLNQAIKIPFPEDATNVATTVSNIMLLGQPIGQTAVDGFILKLNRSAEDAADEAAPIFVDAIANMTVVDGINILMGTDDAATQYLRTNTYTSLKTAFRPDMVNSLNNIGAQTAWNEVTTLYNTVSSNPVNTDLADYATGKALDGLFHLITQEEKLIRTDPAARISDLLQRVFAEQD